MAKHFYHIPLQKTLSFIKRYKTELRAFATKPKQLHYHSQIGKSLYILEIERFIGFFKIDKDVDYALKSLEYFNSKLFITKLSKSLNFTQFELEKNRVEEKSFFYAFCALYAKEDTKGFRNFIEKTLLHHNTAFHNNSNIQIDYQDISHSLAKNRKVNIKESFGEEENRAFFKLIIDEKVVVEQKGKSIKTLRKKAYKEMFNYLLDFK